MFSTLGGLVNIGIVIYLGLQARSCIDPEQLAEMQAAQNPLILSFVAILALFLAVRNKG